MIYFTSDLHLGHLDVIYTQHRPFKNVEQMNRALISNYNSVVRPKDTVYILGDLCNKLSIEKANKLISELNGKKILIRGNHDKHYDLNLFEDICDFKTVSANGTYFILMHYPLLSWPNDYKGSIQVHGHMHSKKEYNFKNKLDEIKRFDVGVDANNFKPVSAQEIADFFVQKLWI